ncbi:DUF1566 domain-containing protein [Ideonella dechloratans]|uniref:DUF1566 domain-containing protein n=1 Tax=Ideonella dechloratans TaxID=36863 RepID=A0A643FBD4_IDEDE|nr:DUF1566 domain-containing protein [Ideonella dechloratans]KAB0577767.1 DUF1566 domain-containing protein [Ideonella dechloratans]UFU11975.1 DUF1566 domain-containing protein [Ideonella dechloratans]
MSGLLTWRDRRRTARGLGLVLGLVLAVGWGSGHAADDKALHQALQEARFALVDDGAGVLDQTTGLVWARCVHGMRWTGRQCTGQADRVTQDAAMQLAVREREGVSQRWRLPHVADLRRLANRLAKVPELVPTLFPQSPRGPCWSATSVIDETAVNPYNYGNIQRGRNADNTVQLRFLHAWAMDPLAAGESSEEPKRTLHLVRLLYPSAP